MGQDKKKDYNDYHFINETIKKRPLTRMEIARRLAAIAGSGILFGCCAAAGFVGAMPTVSRQAQSRAEAQREDITISTPSPEEEQAAGGNKTAEADTEVSTTEEEISLLDGYEAIYKEVLKVSQQPRKALVSVKRMSEDADLLDNSSLSSSDMEGIIFLETDTLLYILTYEDERNAGSVLQVTFTDGNAAVGRLCKEDNQSGLAVVTVKKSDVSQKTLDEIYVAGLGDIHGAVQTKPVIAIGRPGGDRDAVVFGVVTSVSEKFSVADAEYSILATDMHGNVDSNGVLLDTAGNVIGIIIKKNRETVSTVRALPVTQLRSLIEKLSNGSSVMYMGIHGTAIEENEAGTAGNPRGIYVESVEGNSPAMAAGIQSGDIITSMDGEKVRTMQAYSMNLQDKKAGDKMVLIIYRRGADGKYVSRDVNVTIEER